MLRTRAGSADLSKLTPVSGFVKGQPTPLLQSGKPSTPTTAGSVLAASADSKSPSQPMQQLQQPAMPKSVEYERNSLAIKLSNNPLESLAGLQEAAASVLDEPVSIVAKNKPLALVAAVLVAVATGVAVSLLSKTFKIKSRSGSTSMLFQAELRWLDLSQCKLTSIQEELTRFPKLQMLYLHANQITKLSEVKRLGKLTGLQKLTLHGNPIAELPHYK